MKDIGPRIILLLMGFFLLAAGPVSSSPHGHHISWSVFHKDAEYVRKVQADPRRLVEEYCEAEYNGVQDIRLKIVKVRQTKTVSGRSPGSESGESAGKVLNFSSDRLIVVDSYKIKSVTVGEGRAEATVVYRRLASCGGTDGKRYVKDRSNRDTVRLRLDYDGSSWWIVDPPLPRVSKWALIEYSERIITSMNPLVKSGKASEGQKKYYTDNKDIVTFLRSL